MEEREVHLAVDLRLVPRYQQLDAGMGGDGWKVSRSCAW